MCKVLQICKTCTTPYHPEGDGFVEWFNRTLISMLATATADHSLDWEECLPKVCFAYTASVQASTGHTPFYLMFGRQAKLSVDLKKGRPKKLHLPWDGPYRVIKRLSDVNYRIQATVGRHRRLVVHLLSSSLG